MKKYLFSAIYSVILVVFTLAVVLRTFTFSDVSGDKIQEAIDRANSKKNEAVKTPVPTEVEHMATTPTLAVTPEAGATPSATPSATSAFTPTSAPTFTPVPTIVPTWTENSYVDSDMSVRIDRYREYDSDIYVVDIVLNSADFLKTQIASAIKRSTTYATVSEISSVCDNLVVSINGDCWFVRNGYSIKNGVVLRDEISKTTSGITVAAPEQEDLVIFEDGSAKIIREGEVTIDELMEQGAVQLFNFGPTLIENGENVLESSYSVMKEKITGSNPRTAIGVYEDLHYAFVVVDGRTSQSKGMSLTKLAAFGMKLGLETFYNLDGGGSSTLYFNGEVINKPCRNKNKIAEQGVNDIVYVAY